ncbi:MAG: CapA family protein [Epulopiscium sp.]|nr:CapA family protein [Candidatus Epulonipiscium sp.]
MKKTYCLFYLLTLVFLTSCGQTKESNEIVANWNIEGNTQVAMAINGENSNVVLEEISIEKKEPEIHSAKMKVVGDIMVHEWQIEAAFDKESNTYDFGRQFELVKPFLEDGDITIGNLETTLAGSEAGYSGYPRFNTPDSLGDSLKDSGFDILTTANNHSLDTNAKGALRTLDILDKLEIEHTGTYRSQEESEQIIIKEVNTISFAFLSYTYGTNGIPIPKEHSYLVNLIDMEKMKADIRKAKGLSPDFIVVSIHFGEEYQEYPNGNQKQIVDELFDVGADIILGSHPHVIQSMETRKITRDDGSEKICFVIYSLGNFVSSQRTPLYPPRDAGIILNLDFEKIENEKAELKSVSFMPTWVQFSKKDGKRLIRVIGNNLSEEELKEELNGDEINRFKSTREYILQHLLGENEIRIKDDFYVYPF